MKLRPIVSFAVFTCLLYFTPVHAGAIPSTGTTEVYFSPNGGATETVVSEISKAKQEILVQAYSFTSKPIAKALLDARKRGVSVEAQSWTEATSPASIRRPHSFSTPTCR